MDVKKKRILYLSFNGMLESLGASQVLSYLYGLSTDYEIMLISFEKEEDIKEINNYNQLKKNILQYDINWKPIIYNSHGLAKKLNVFRYYKKVIFTILKYNFKYVHCRSYVTVFPVFALSYVKKIDYLFDTRSFSIDERADVGSLNRDKWLYKFVKILEAKLYNRSAATVILSKKGIQTIKENKLFKGGDQIDNLYFIPTCVDLERFNLLKRNHKKPFVNIGYVGTAIGWYDFDKTLMTLAKIGEFIDYRFIVFNSNKHNQHKFIKDKLKEYKIPLENCVIEKVTFGEMPRRLGDIDISLFYIKPFFSKNASAATKLGELLATGIPVLTNKECGDHEYYIKNYNVGKILAFDKLETYDFKSIIEPLLSEKTSLRCRKLAEKYFSLSRGINDYKFIYKKIFK